MAKARKAPYALRSCRRNIDLWTFTLYSHWVKRGEGMGQNRAAMFQHKRRVDEKISSSPDVTITRLDANERRQTFTV